VVSGPSGSGKHTVLQEAMKRDDGFALAVTATTRPPREGEIDAKDYYFYSREEFRRRIDAGEFAEFADVHGELYGTPRHELERHLASGKDVLLQIDVQGMRTLRTSGLDPVTVFLVPPSVEELEARLRGRATENAADLALRLRNAHAEIAARDEFDHVIVNDDLAEAVAEFLAIVRNDREQRSGGSG